MEKNHAEENARGWASTIAALVAALNCDYDRLEELREERASLVEDLQATSEKHSPHGHKVAKAALANWDESNLQELNELVEAATVDGHEFKSQEEARERIQESPLSVQVRSGWYTPGECGVPAPEEFEVLLSTGGPALRILGELDEHGEPARAWLEYQDWGTSWTHFYVKGGTDDLLAFCQCFYFGEG